jgi:hypothetical protein
MELYVSLHKISIYSPHIDWEDINKKYTITGGMCEWFRGDRQEYFLQPFTHAISSRDGHLLLIFFYIKGKVSRKFAILLLVSLES